MGAYWELARVAAHGGRTKLTRTPRVPHARIPAGAGRRVLPLRRRAAGALGAVAGRGVRRCGRSGRRGPGRTVVRPFGGTLAGAVAAVYPDAVSMSVFVLSEAPFCPLLLLQLCLWTVACERFGAASSSLGVSGWRGGRAGDVDAPQLALVHSLGGGHRSAGSGRVREIGLARLWLILGLAAAMTPWWVRNWRVTGGVVPTTLQVGESLYDGTKSPGNRRQRHAIRGRFPSATPRRRRQNPVAADRTAASRHVWIAACATPPSPGL